VSRASRLNILTIASEMTPFAKTGGLADVVSSLPAALEALGHGVTTVLPRYRHIAVGDDPLTRRRIVVGRTPHEVIFRTRELSPNRRVVFVDEPTLFERASLYEEGGRDYPDNARRFAVLSTAALEFAQHEDGVAPDVVHTHDWQGGIGLALLGAQRERWPRLSHAGRVFTIHNMAYQGLFPRDTVPDLGLPWSVFAIDTAEFWNQFSFLKAGITYSDYVTTVSPSYAAETLTTEFGAGMEGVLAARGPRFVGILNGIDTTVWDPATDPLLPARYSVDDLSGKRACKLALLDRFGLPRGDDAMARPLIAMVSRLVEQKGIDLVQEASEALAALDATWVFVGSGEARFEHFLREFAASHPTRAGVHIGFDERLAHLVEAGADMFLMPSRFEPCGLNQMYSLRYGTVPIVHAVGGLDDTVQPYSARSKHANGFKFREPTASAMVAAVRQALRLHHDRETWHRLMRTGMQADHSWSIPAREYVKVYRRARLDAAARAAGRP
jgi:starch synthase